MEASQSIVMPLWPTCRIDELSLQDFASHKFRRVVSSTLMAEASALVEALSAVQWLVSWRGYATQANYKPPRSQLGEIELKPIEKIATAASDAILAIVDSKLLYDVLDGESIDGVDKRTGLDVLMCRDILTTLGGAVRWIPLPQRAQHLRFFDEDRCTPCQSFGGT
eukprot:2417054-Amphidinium_carterae.1